MEGLERPIISVRNLRKQFGEGCSSCKDIDKGIQKGNYCPECGTVYACKDISFDLYSGEILGVVGESGSGKSTLMGCLYFDQEVTRGEAYISSYKFGEVNIFNESPQQKRYIRNNVLGKVYQNPMDGLKMDFSSIGNIAEKENRELIMHAAKQSLANVLVEGLPGKYDQALGKRFNQGVELSGGEWQKIALARAYMKDAQLLILDEPTSALDARAEYEVFQRFSDLTKGKSAVLISHRFSTVRMADRILVLEKGELLESGNHEDLLQKNGRYAELFRLQAKGYQ